MANKTRAKSEINAHQLLLNIHGENAITQLENAIGYIPTHPAAKLTI